MDKRFSPQPSSRGGMHVWKWPEDGRQYVIGVDSAGGGPESDYSVAIVLEAENMEVVCMWRDRMGPNSWGRACAFLGWFYNEALLAFETGASAHGMSAAHAAAAINYHRLYKRERANVITRDMTEMIGWRTDVSTKPQLIADLREALESGMGIPSEDLIVELKAQRYDENEKIVADVNDDMVIALGVAVTVRRRSWTIGLLKRQLPGPKGEHEVFWANQERKFKDFKRSVARGRKLAY